MLWEHNSTIVVMLTKLREMGRVRVLLWGEGGCGAAVCGHDLLAHLSVFGTTHSGRALPCLVADPVAPQPHRLSGSGREEQLMLVLMSCPTAHQQEKCHQYWPAERSARYQYFVVDPMAEYNMPQYILREFKVTDARVSASSGSSAPLLPMPLPYPTAPLSKGSCPDSCVSPMSSSGIPVSTRSCLACAAHLVKHLTQSPCTWTMCVQHLTRHRTFVLQ